MDKKNPFTKKKFLSLPLFSQHKKCATWLCCLYEKRLLKDTANESSLLSHYNQMANWIGITPLIAPSLEKISDRYHFHLGKTNFSPKEHNLLPSLRTGDRKEATPFLTSSIYLQNIRSAYNVGSILRTAEALRIGSVHFSKNTPFINNVKVQKTAMGAEKFVSCYQNSLLEELPTPLIGLDTFENAISIYDFIFPKTPFTLVLGNEEYGIEEEVRKKLDYLIEIPMLGRKNSINVAAAFAIAASQIQRQVIF